MNNEEQPVPPVDRELRWAELHKFLEEEIWSQIPPEELGKPIPQEEQDEILGYGPDGYCL